MGVSVDPLLLDRLRGGPGRIAVLVRDVPPELSVRALERLRRALLQLDDGADWADILEAEGIPGIKSVGHVSFGGGQAALWFNGGDTPAELLLQIPDLLIRYLSDLGVESGEVTVPPLPRLLKPDGQLPTAPNAVTLRLYPDPPWVRRGVSAPLPSAWVEAAWAWIQAFLHHPRRLWATGIAAEFELDAGEAREYLRRSHHAAVSGDHLLGGEPGDRLAVIGLHFGSGTMTLSAAGEALTGQARRDVIAALQSVAVGLAPEACLAFIDLERSLSGALGVRPPGEIWRQGDGASPDLVAGLCDELLFDTYPFQVVGPGHVRRLGSLPVGATELTHGRATMSFGEPEEWLPDSPERAAVRARARAALAPCLVSRREATELFYERWGRPRLA
jgi:hypothetical protein